MYVNTLSALLNVFYKHKFPPEFCKTKKQTIIKQNKLRGLYRPSDRRLSVTLVPTFADREYHVVSVTDSYGRILGFLDRSRSFFFQVAPQLYSRGWICSQELWPLYHRGGQINNHTLYVSRLVKNYWNSFKFHIQNSLFIKKVLIVRGRQNKVWGRGCWDRYIYVASKKFNSFILNLDRWRRSKCLGWLVKIYGGSFPVLAKFL
jgi:hypothetical protein